jgi:DNA-binding GntR family transcriptional regulator
MSKREAKPETRAAKGGTKNGRKRVAAPIETIPENGAEDPALSTQTEAALDLIRSKIVDMTLEPGSRVDERLLIEQFKLGRTPAREAINRLTAEGFVTMRPQRGGTYVRKLDLDEMGQVIVAHELAETILGQLCDMDDPTALSDLKDIQRRYVDSVKRRQFLEITLLNQAFHLRLHRTVGNNLFYDFAESTHRHVRRLNVYIYLSESREPAYQSSQFEMNIEQHNRIIDIFASKDRDRMSEMLPQHAKNNQTRLVRLLQKKSLGNLRLDLSAIRVPFGPASTE